MIEGESFQGASADGWIFQTPVAARQSDGLLIAEGDMIVSAVNPHRGNFIERLLSDPRPFGFGRDAASALWPKAKIHYRIDSPRLAEPLQRALALFERTPLQFVPVTPGVRDFVIIRFGLDYASAVGRQGGPQPLLVKNDMRIGSIAHELCHAAGLLHEHSRPDRGDWISIDESAVHADALRQFDVLHLERRLGGYDYGSIMHYGATAFSSDGRQTIRPLRAHAGEIGQREALSDGDHAALNTLYSAA